MKICTCPIDEDCIALGSHGECNPGCDYLKEQEDGKARPKVNEYPWGYYEIETDHFFSRVYKHGGGHGRPETLRAECSVKIGERKYQVAWRHFHEWDYRDKDDAYDSAKRWIREAVLALADELSDAFEVIRDGK